MFIPTKDQQARLLSSALQLLTTLNNGIEDMLGRGSKGIIFNTGMEDGKFLGKNLPKTESVEEAVEEVNKAFEGVWKVEVFAEKGKDTPMFTDEMGNEAMKIVVHECPIRQAVLSHGMKQGGPICHLTNGNLCGMISEITGRKTGMEIEHAGPNSCLKRVYIRS
jgi:predicted hydrocarbon binding protein